MTLWRSSCKLEDNIQMDHKEIFFECGDCNEPSGSLRVEHFLTN
jgi:hypothetical protein